MLYCLQAREGGPLKLGFAACVLKRKRQLERRYGQELEIIAVWPGGRTEETALLRRFAAYRMGRSELFRPVDEIASYIGRPLLVGENSEVEPLAYTRHT